MKTALLIFIALFLISSGIAVHFWQQLRVQDLTAQIQDTESKRELQIARDSLLIVNRASDSTIQSERQLRAEIESKGTEREKVFVKRSNEQKSQIARLKEERTNAGIEIDTLTAEIEHRSDSLILAQSQEITALKADLGMITKSFEHDHEAMDDKLDAQLEVSLKAITRVDVLETKVIRLERKLLGWKIGAAVLGGLLVYESVKD